ncbi:hypothetical protein CS542_00250 [Pedobacter sp. IW39]|nr:hypothetical protein CS542_00250 [Pedobacter sp. IW39]
MDVLNAAEDDSVTIIALAPGLSPEYKAPGLVHIRIIDSQPPFIRDKVTSLPLHTGNFDWRSTIHTHFIKCVMPGCSIFQ